jgi:hypothetical protein
MPKITYEPWNPKPEVEQVVASVNGIVTRYQQRGYDLTLRQVYYQMIAKDLFPESWIDEQYNLKNGLDPRTKNTQKNYKRLGDYISKGRRAGMIDWSAIVDRTRNLMSLGTWESPSAIVDAVAEQFRYDRWATQPSHVEVWFEKDALMGVFERIANEFRVPYFSCRGYTSDSEVWGAAQRLARRRRAGKDIVILHFGDHDPSGIDMTRDIADRLALFGARGVDVRRLALNMDQVEQYDPPPNPAKESDSRFASYRDLYGDESWELDALEPEVLAELVRAELDTIIEQGVWEGEVLREQQARRELSLISQRYDDVVSYVSDGEEEG